MPRALTPMPTRGWLGFALAAAVAACTSGAPPGFSSATGGNHWTFPLVGPLEGGPLLTAVMLNTHGPYVFAIDPDAPVSIIDAELVREADLRAFAGPPRLDETDTQRTRSLAELTGMEVGSLILERREALIVPARTFDTGGRRVHGVIGRDILADSLAFGFNRDRGLGYLVMQKAFRPPAGAVELPYALLEPRIPNVRTQPEPRRIVRAEIGGEAYPLHVDLGATASQLREALWERAKLVPRELQAVMVDELGTMRRITRASEPVAATAGGASGTVAFVPYADKRWDESAVAGTLGLSFFGNYTVWLSWDQRALFLARREPFDARQRIARWDSPVLGSCPNLGCVSARLVDPLAGKPPEEGKPHPGVVLSMTRDERAGGMDLELVLEAQGEPPLPYLIANLPAHVDRLIHQLKPEFLGRTLAVVDASPHPRRCPGGAIGGCVDQLAR